jgi:hypothetical protein
MGRVFVVSKLRICSSRCALEMAPQPGCDLVELAGLSMNLGPSPALTSGLAWFSGR